MRIANKIKVNDLCNFSIIYVFEVMAKTVLCVLIGLLIIIMAWLTIHTAYSFAVIFKTASASDVASLIFKNALLILAILEIFRTALLYYSEGRVKVTYIIDTVIVGVLTEIKGLWFTEMEYKKLIFVVSILLTLVVVRILTIQFSPSRENI